MGKINRIYRIYKFCGGAVRERLWDVDGVFIQSHISVLRFPFSPNVQISLKVTQGLSMFSDEAGFLRSLPSRLIRSCHRVHPQHPR